MRMIDWKNIEPDNLVFSINKIDSSFIYNKMTANGELIKFEIRQVPEELQQN